MSRWPCPCTFLIVLPRLTPGSILAQVEGAPVVVKKGLKKEEAEELQKKLEAVGAKIVLE